MDVTPLLGATTGVGRYVASLIDSLAQAGSTADGDAVRGTAFTLRNRAALPGRMPPRTSLAGPPVPARLLQRLWSRSDLVPVTWLSGPVDVFHGTNFVLPPTGGAAGVVTIHDLSYLRTPHTVNDASLAYRELVPRSIRRAAVVCTPSQAVADEVSETYRVPPDRIAVTPLGVVSSWATAQPLDDAQRRRLGLPRDYYVFSGSLEPRKNLPLLLEAQRRLRAADPQFPTLVLMGPPGWGPRLDLLDLAPDAVILTGYLDDEVLHRTVAGARLLVYPSAYEGFGLPPLEAFACGVPVVASDLPVVREVIGADPELVGLVPPGDVDALTEAVHARLTTSDPRDAANRRRAHAADFTWARTAQLTRRAYALAQQLTAP
jgi:glycosyltransferase involved in cell wall biosynthesis